MADNVDPIVIPIEVDDKDSLMSMNQVQAAIGDLSSQLNELRKQSESPIADYTRDFNQQIGFAEQGLARLLDLRKKVDVATSSTDRTRTTKIFEDEYRRMETVVEDLKQSMSTSKTLFSSFSDGLEKEFANGIKTFAPRIKQAFRQMADSITRSSGTTGDESLIDLFQHSDVYKNTMKSLQSRNASVFSDTNMKSYLRSILSTSVPQYDRGKFVDWVKNDYAAKTVREMLPKAFSNIQLSGPKAYAPFQARTKSLSSAETLALQKLITDNPYVASELEQAGIMRRYNGMAYYNPNTKRANVNAFAGLIANMFETGARGGPSSGITNIEDPAFQQKIVRKSNMFMNNSMRVATQLADMFPWLNPQHMEVPQTTDFRPSVNGKPGNWRTLGEYRAKPRQTAMEFYEFGLDELGADGQIAFKDGKARYTRVNNSLMQSALSSRQGATKFTHNGFNDNEVYLSLPVGELSDYETTPERKKELQQQISRAISQTPTIGGYRYKFGGFTPTHAVYEREDLYDQIIKESPNFFMNGEDRRVFSSYKDFSKALEATRKLRTEGEDIRTLYGSDLSNARVVVARMKDITGLDGQNWIDSGLVPETFQGRDVGGKATFSKVDIAALWKMYPQLVDKTTGDLVLPTGGINGGQLVIPKGTSIIEDIENIKTKHQYDNLSQEEINRLRTEEIRTNGIFAKTTADAAATSPRFISSQAAGTMHFGTDARRYFNNVFLHELASLEDVGSVKELLFSGDDALSRMVQQDEGFLNTEEARKRIDEYRESLFAHAGKGDILIPRGSANYAMISAWLPDVMARLIPEDQLTDEQKSWRLADINKRTGLIAGSGTESEDVISKVAYFASKADELGLYRNPATASGNIKISNAAIDDGMKSIATALGVDTSALYVDPKSVILKLMQGADEDGDTAFVAALKNNKKFGDIMSQVLIDTASAYKKMRELGGRTDEQQERVKELYSKDLEFNQSEFNIGNADDVASWWVGSKLAGMKMGAANAVSVGARQFRPSQRITRAILDAESHYDVDSTGRLKNAKEWEMTEDEKRVLYDGAPFFQIANWAKKSVTEDIDEEGKQRIVFDQDAFNRRAIDKVNFASINDPHALLSEYSSFMAHIMHPEAKSEFDWDAIMGALPQVNSNTATGRLTSRLRELKQGRLNNEFLFFNDDVINELSALKKNALTEIISEVYRDKNISGKEKQIEISKKLANAGGTVVDNLLQFGLTRRNIEANPELKREFEFLQSLTDGSGVNLFAAAKDYTVSTEGVSSYPEYIQKEQAKVEQQIAEKEKTLQQLQQASSNDQQSQQQHEAIRRIDDQIALEKNKLESNRQERIQQYLDSVTGTEEEGSFFTSDFPAEIPSKEELQRQIAEANTQLEIAKKNSEAHKKEAENYFKSIDDDNPETKRSIDIENRIKQTEAEDARQIKFLENSLTNYQQQLNDYYGALTSPELESLQMQRAELVGQMPQEQQAIQQQTQALNQEIAVLQQQRNGLAQQNAYTQEYEAVQAEYNRLMSDAGQFSSELFKSVMSKQNKIDGVSRAKTFYDSQHGIANAYLSKMQNVMGSGLLQDTQLQDMMKVYQRISTNVDKEFAAKAVLNSKYLSEDLEQKAAPAGGIWGKQEQELDAYLDKLKEAEEYKNILLGLAADPNTDKQSQDDFKAAADKVDEYLKHASEQYDKYKEKLTLNNQIMEAQRIERENAQVDQFVLRGQQMSFSKSGATRNDIFSKIQQQQVQIVSQYASYISSGEGMLSELKKKHLDQAVGSKEYITTANNIEKLGAALANAKVEMESFQGASGLAKIAIAQLGATTQHLITQFGHRMFQRAIQETKRFVQEYDKDMTTIQMITLKSDSEIGDLGQNLIQKAVDMRASVSETTSAAAELYRQGLSDEEVDTRLEDVIKFSKVAGIKTTEASKIITTALQNGLVNSSTEAMDALVALGDSAATTASEIAKGMQKTAASAKQAGVSYAQLITLLTIGTSKTQLGGSSIGSALQTIFYRLQKVGNNEDFYDENGRHIAANAAMQAMAGFGVSAFDDNGNMRNPYDVLVDISSRWESADDVTQSKLLTTLGAGRQRSNVATLLQGLSEDNGELANRYNDLATNSQGITDQKYQEYLKSLEAAITNVRTSFDQLISTFNAGATASSVLNFVATLIQGFTKVNDLLGGVPTLLTTIAVAAAGIMALFKFSSPIGWLSVGLGGLAAVVSGVGAGIKAIEDANYKNSDEYIKKQQKEQLQSEYERKLELNSGSLGYSAVIEESQQLGKEYEELGDKMDETKVEKFRNNLKSLVTIFPELGSNISNNVDILDSWKDIVDGAALSAEKIIQIKDLEAAKEITESNVQDVADQLQKDLDEIERLSKAQTTIDEFTKDNVRFDSQLTDNLDGAYVKQRKDIEFTIGDLRSELQALQDEFNNLSIANIPVGKDATSFVTSMTELLSALDGMPDGGYDFSSLENLNLEQLSSQAVNIKSAIEAIDNAVSNNVISQETANAMKAPLEQALISLQTKIDEFNNNNKENPIQVHVEDDSDNAKKNISSIPDGPNGTGYDDAFINVESDADTVKQKLEEIVTDQYTATVQVQYDFGQTANDQQPKVQLTEAEAEQLRQKLDEVNKNNVVAPTYATPNGSTYNKSYIPNFNGLTAEDTTVLNLLEQEKSRLFNFWNSFIDTLIKDPEHNIEAALDKLNASKEDLVKAINTNVPMDKILDIKSTMSDIQEILDAFFQLSTTVGSINNGHRSSSLLNIKNARLSAGASATDVHYVSNLPDDKKSSTIAEETLKPSFINWLDENAFKPQQGINPSSSLYNGLSSALSFFGINVNDYSSVSKRLFGLLGEDSSKIDIDLNGIYQQQIDNMKGENSPYYYLLASMPNSFSPNTRIASINGLDYTIDNPETITATKDILTYLYEYLLPKDENYNKASYKNVDEFIADWDNEKGSFSNFTLSGINQDPLSYISDYFDKITNESTTEYSDYQNYLKDKMNAVAKAAFDSLFGVDDSGNSIVKAFDQFDNSDVLKGVIKNIIETQHSDEAYSGWINPDNLNDVVSSIDKELLEYIKNPEKYIKDKATDAFVQNPTSLLQTAIGMFNEVNDTKNTADVLFEEMQAAIKNGNLSTLQDLFDRFGTGEEFKDLGSVIYDDKKGVLGQVLKEFSDENGEQIIDENGIGLKQFLIALASLTGAYTDAANEILPDIAENAKNYLTSRNETLYSDFSSLVGSSLAIKYKTGEELSPIESSYMNTIIGNAANGISGLTDIQQFEGMRTLFDLANSGNFNYGSIDSKVLSAYTSGSKVLDDYLSASSALSNAGLDASKLQDITPYTDEFNQYNKVLKDAGTSVQTFLKLQQQLDQEFATTGINAVNEYGNQTKEVASIVSNMKGTTQDALQEQQKLNKLLSSAANNQYYRNQWRAGNRDKETYEAIASMLSIDKGQIDVIGEDLINNMLESLSNLDLSQIQTYGYAIGEMMTQSLQDAVINEKIDLTTAGIDVHNGPVTLDIAETLAKLGNILDDETKALLQLLQQWGIDANTIITEEDGKIKARIQINSIGSGRGGGQYRSGAGSSGGGGNGGNNNSKKEKTPAEILTEAIKNRKTIWDHRIKMVQFQQTYYEQDDQLGNYGKMIEAENAIRREMGPVLEQNLKDLQAELAQTAKNTKEWYSLRDAILETEEAIEDNNNAIEANNKKLKQNEYEIRKRRVDLENLVRDEIKRRIEEYRNQVQGASDLENLILDIIKQRYEEQWDLMKKDIDKKKDALNEEKSLINERLQARKNAEDKASKYEMLAEYKRQLALIQMDRTRTREAAELRKKIAELQGTIGWNIAEEEATAQTEEIDQQIKAYDDYEKSGDEALERFLKDANNMKDEIKQVMNYNHDDLINWLRLYSEDYKNSLENTRETMEFGWHDLYNQANGIVETFNEQVEKILANQDTYIEYMKQSSEYLNATKDAQTNMVTDWMDAYDRWYKSLDRSATYSHNDNNYYSDGRVYDTDNGSSYSGGGGSGGYGGGDYGGDSSDYLDIVLRDKTYYKSANFEGYHASGSGTSEKQAEFNAKDALLSYLRTLEIQGDETAGMYLEYLDRGTYSPQYKEESQLFEPFMDGGNSGSSGYNSGSNNYSGNNSGSSSNNNNNNNNNNNSIVRGSNDYKPSYQGTHGWIAQNDKGLWLYAYGFGSQRAAKADLEDLINKADAAAKSLGIPSTKAEYFRRSGEFYKNGGLVDYTGPAWVDGTPTAPEAFLSAPDTKMIRELVDYLHYIPVPFMTHLDSSMFNNAASSNIESIVVNINEASISDDVDIENLADRIGQQFNRELEKQGFTTARYRFY